MTSAGEAAGSPPLPAAVGGHRRSPLDRLPPPANTTKPLTPFGIEDILGRPRGGSPPGTGTGPAAPPAPTGPRGGGGGCAPASPLWALEELASKTFQGLELGMLQAAGGTGAGGLPGRGDSAGSGAGVGNRASGTGQVAGLEGGGEAVARSAMSLVARPGKFPPYPRGVSAAGRPEKPPGHRGHAAVRVRREGEVLGPDTGNPSEPRLR